MQRKDAMSQPIHQDEGLTLVSLVMRIRHETSNSPARSKNSRILFSFFAYSSYPSGLFFAQMILGIKSMARYISPTYENPKLIMKYSKKNKSSLLYQHSEKSVKIRVNKYSLA